MKSRIFKCFFILLMLPIGHTHASMIWCEADYTNRSVFVDNTMLPTSAVVQLLYLSSDSQETSTPLHLGKTNGLTGGWRVINVAKIPRSGFIMGFFRTNSLPQGSYIMRAIIPSSPYTGDGTTIPNPSVSGGLWSAQAPIAFVGGANDRLYKVHISTGLWTFVTLNPQQDGDGDGLPDAWEWAHFDHPTAGVATNDADEDGVSNLDEMKAGTNPNDTNSYLRVEVDLPESPGLNLSWFALSNVMYSVECSTNSLLQNLEFTTILSNVVVAESSFYTTNLPSAVVSAIYRLTAQLLPP